MSSPSGPLLVLCAPLGITLSLVLGCAGDAPSEDSGPFDDPTLGAIQVETLEDPAWADYSLTT